MHRGFTDWLRNSLPTGCANGLCQWAVPMGRRRSTHSVPAQASRARSSAQGHGFGASILVRALSSVFTRRASSFKALEGEREGETETEANTETETERERERERDAERQREGETETETEIEREKDVNAHAVLRYIACT